MINPRNAIVPVRGIITAMSKLRSSLDFDLVSKIVECLLVNTIHILRENGLKPIILTADNALIQKLNSKNISTISDSGNSLNQAIAKAVTGLKDDRIILIMPDLPGLNVDSLGKILHLSEIHPNIISPTSDNGTAIAVLPKLLLQGKLFGKNSAIKLQNLAEKSGIPIAVIEMESCKRDMDTIEDWLYWKSKIETMNQRMADL